MFNFCISEIFAIYGNLGSLRLTYYGDFQQSRIWHCIHFSQALLFSSPTCTCTMHWSNTEVLHVYALLQLETSVEGTKSTVYFLI